MTAGGQGLFPTTPPNRQGVGLLSLCICIEYFKNLLVRNDWTDFSIIWQKCYQNCSSHDDLSKNRVARGGIYFPCISSGPDNNFLISIILVKFKAGQ